MDAKLAAHRLAAFRWAITTLRDHVAHEGRELIVVLIPAANDPARQDEVFAGPREILRELKVLTADLLDTFAATDDFGIYRVVEGDVHPNQEGHRRIFEQLVQKMKESPALRAAITGRPDEPSARGAGQ
jgi:hypothetical protein